jgi:hypothetical protein
MHAKEVGSGTIVARPSNWPAIEGSQNFVYFQPVLDPWNRGTYIMDVRDIYAYEPYVLPKWDLITGAHIRTVSGELIEESRKDFPGLSGTIPEGWWHCDCGADNDPNISPLKCGICRRYKE